MITIKDILVKEDSKTECWVTIDEKDSFYVKEHLSITGSPPKNTWSNIDKRLEESMFIENTKLKKEIKELKLFIEKHFKQMAKGMEENE